MSQLRKNLVHSKAAYLFALHAIPSKKTAFPCDRHGFRFEKPSQIQSMIIELGWAFFCRYEASLEAYLKDKGVFLSKKLSLADWLKKQDIEIPSPYEAGLSCYRQIRNQLHHKDGAALNGMEDKEIHLLPDIMEKFYELFVWLGEQIEIWANKANAAD